MVSIISETTGEAVVPTKQVNPGSFTQELAPDSYSVIIQGLQPNHSNFQEFGYPLVYGRKNHVAVTAGNSTTTAITMVDFRLDHSPNEVGSYITPNPYDWGLGKLPQNLSVSGYTFNGWYSDSSFQTVITEFPDTTDYAHLSYPVAKFTQNGTTPGGTPLPTGTGIYFANATGTGTGDSPESPKAFSTLLSTLNAGSLSNSSSGYPKIYLLEDITISSGISISNKVHIIGAKGGIANEPVTITNTSFMLGADYSAITFGSNSYIIDNVTIHGGGTYRGISNNGTLTLDNCTITNCMATNGAGILNNGILTLEEGTSIINCSATGDGKSIYCDYEDGRTVKVNNYDFLSDAWYDSVIDETNPYSNTTWTITPPDTSVEGIYYANASGTGDGTTSEKARAFSALIADATLKNYSPDGYPRIYLLEDITGRFTINRNVRIEGVENEETHEKPTITGSGTPILTISNDVVCIIKGIDINGIISYRGITNNGTLTLNDCSITGCRNSEGAGIYNKGTLTLENGTSISRDEYSTKGKSIYCEYVDGKTVKVNNDIFTSDAWYDYSIDTTTPYDRDLWIKTAPTGTGIYFAKASGSGDGRSLNNARALSSLLSETLTNSSEGYPVIYLMENITISSGSSGLTISNKVKLIGAKGGVLNERVTIQKNGSSNSDSNTITFGSDSYIVQNVTIHGGGSNRGILNNGTLTLDNCEIKNCTEENGAGILNKGTVTLINGTSIIGYATEKGNSIYCDSENESTVKVNDDAFTSDAWYDDSINATTPYDSSSWTIGIPEGTGIYFANTNGQGDGTSISNPISLNTLISNTQPLTNYPEEDAPRIYLLDDIISALTVKKNVRIIGAKDGVIGQKTTLTRTGSGGTLLTINSSFTCTIEDVIIDGNDTRGTATYQGISNSGTLTLDNCEIKNCSGTSGGGILNKGNLTLQNGTTIKDCQGSKGISIYCDSENGSTVKVNNDTFTSDAWYDNAIDATTPYDSSSWTIGIPEGTGIYFANASGTGNGSSMSNPKALSTLIADNTLVNYSNDGCPRIYLLEDITGSFEVNQNLNIIGAKNGYLNQKSTITSTDDTSTPVFTINNEITCFLDDLIIDGSTDGTAAHQGISNNGTLTLNKCNIKNCTAANGAGISNSGTAVLTLTDSFIGNCTATTGGGGIYSDSNGSVTLSGTKITGCNVNTTSSQGKGGGIYCDTGSLTLKDGSTVSGCKASYIGGGIYFSSPGTLTITDSTIGGDNESDKCTATYGGGISTTETGSLVISGTSKIKNCTATSYGGGLYILNQYSPGQTLNLSGTTISYCEANNDNSSGDGGGIYVNFTQDSDLYPTLTISNCTIDHCTVPMHGGGICVHKGNVVLNNDSTITYCMSEDAVNGMGGAISITTNNSNQGTMSVTNTTISHCSTEYRGGALSCQGTCTLGTGTVITECTTRDAGGAIYAVGPNCKLTLESNSKIDNCSATQTGGAIFLYNESTVTLESGAQITNCTAPSGGGIALNSNAKLSLKDGAIITGCKANNSPNSLFTISNGIINNSTISGDTKYYYNYDITADDKYNRSKLSTSPSAS